MQRGKKIISHGFCSFVTLLILGLKSEPNLSLVGLVSMLMVRNAWDIVDIFPLSHYTSSLDKFHWIRELVDSHREGKFIV